MGAHKLKDWFGRYRSCLGHRDLRLLFAGLMVSQTGSWAYNVGLLALVYTRTHSFAWIGYAGIARFLPALLASTYGGVLAERTERIRLMMGADLVCMGWQLGLVGVALTRAPVGLALVFAACTQVTNVVYNPAVAATIPAIVGETDLVAANALNSTIDNLVVIMGPAIGAVMLLAGSPSITFAANAISFGISALVVSRISVRSRPVDVTEAGTVGPLRQMLVGVHTILSRRSARTLVSLCAVTSFVYGTDTVLFVAVSEHRLGLGSEGFGYLLAGLGIGGIVMALAMDRVSQMPKLALVILLGMALYALPTAAYAFLHDPTAGFVIQIVRGAATLIVDVLAMTSLQRSVPTDELARVFGVFWAVVLTAICLGALLAPVLVDSLGLGDALLTMAGFPFAVGLLGFTALVRVEAEAAAQAETLAPRVAVLDRLDMFATAHRMVLERLASVETAVTFAAGDVIVAEGDVADAMYVLEEGQVVVRARNDDGGGAGGAERIICTLEAPAYFGEIGLIEGIPRTATVEALGPCRCGRIEGADLLEALTVAGPSASLLHAARSRMSVTRGTRVPPVQEVMDLGGSEPAAADPGPTPAGAAVAAPPSAGPP